jgi:hypothetical protein
MLPVYIQPSYKGIVARTVSLPRDAEDLITIHSRSDYSPLSSFQPTSSTIELFYRRFLDWSSYGAYLLSCHGTTLFLLELMPVDLTELGNYYTPACFDYSIGIKLGIDRDRMEEAVQALLAGLEGIFSENLGIYRLVSRVTYSEPGSLLREVMERAGFEKLAEVAEGVIYVRWR